MKKNSASQSGFFHPRVFLALALCLVGVSLAVISLAAPGGASQSTATPAFAAAVSMSVANGISAPVRDLPLELAAARNFEHELPPVKPGRAIPQGFVDPAVQVTSVTGTRAATNAAQAAPAMPVTSASFDGMNQAEACGGCVPPDPNGAVG